LTGIDEIDRKVLKDELADWRRGEGRDRRAISVENTRWIKVLQLRL